MFINKLLRDECISHLSSTLNDYNLVDLIKVTYIINFILNFPVVA